MLKIARYKSTLAKLWIKHNGGQVIQVPTAGCDNVSDLVKAVKKELPIKLTAFDSNELTLHQAMDATALEPDLPISSISAAGLSAKSPLIVKAPEKKSKVALVLQSNATIEEKESLLEDFLQAKEREVQAKDREMQAKEREVQAKDSLLEELKEKLRGIESERDFLKGTLNARSILERYEKRFKDKNFSRTQNWKMHLDRNPALMARLQECDKNISWHDKVVDIYKHLSEIVHQDTSRLGGGRFLVMIRKNLPEIDVCFIQAIAEQIYGEHVRVNAKADEED
eukprot:jgi/Hompol1/168/HPOL_003018-RA